MHFIDTFIKQHAQQYSLVKDQSDLELKHAYKKLTKTIFETRVKVEYGINADAPIKSGGNNKSNNGTSYKGPRQFSY